MGELVDSYLNKLEAKLLKALPKDVADDHVKEIGAHLNESIASQIDQGKTEVDATSDALKSVGSYVLVADGLIRAHAGITEESVWRTAAIPASLSAMYWFLPMAWHSWQPGLLMWSWVFLVPLLFVVTFVRACVRSRRLLIAPTGLALFLVLLGAIADNALYYRVPNQFDASVPLVEGVLGIWAGMAVVNLIVLGVIKLNRNAKTRSWQRGSFA